MEKLLRHRLDDAELFAKHVHECMSGITVSEQAAIVAAALHRLAVSHFEALTQLLRLNRRASALALVRPCTDAAQRAIYVFLFADDQLLNAIAKDDPKAFKTQGDMVGAIHRKLGEYIFEDVHNSFGKLSGYTHGGADQINRQFSADGTLDESVPDLECFEALVTAAFPISMISNLFVTVWTGSQVRGAQLIKQYVQLFPIPPAIRKSAEKLGGNRGGVVVCGDFVRTSLFVGKRHVEKIHPNLASALGEVASLGFLSAADDWKEGFKVPEGYEISALISLGFKETS